MSNKIIEYNLYFFNIIIFVFGTVLFSYYSNSDIHNKTLIELNCGSTYFLSFISLINSIICLICFKYLYYLGVFSTTAIFIYNSYNIPNIFYKCILNDNMVWFYYLYCIILNGIIIFIYLISFIEYIHSKKNNKINNKINNFELNENNDSPNFNDINDINLLPHIYD